MHYFFTPDWVLYVFACVLVMLDAIEVFGVEIVQYAVYNLVVLYTWVVSDPIEQVLTLYGLGEVAYFLWRIFF